MLEQVQTIIFLFWIAVVDHELCPCSYHSDGGDVDWRVSILLLNLGVRVVVVVVVAIVVVVA